MKIPVDKEFLQELLNRLEEDFEKIESEWSYGLRKEDDPTISKLRSVLNDFRS